MTTRKYSSRSQQTTLTSALTSSGTSATVVSGTALLGGVTISAGEIFTVVIDPDTALEEIVDVSAVSTNTLTIVRGIDGSTGQAHSAGAVVRHMAIGRDYREANTHIESTTGHGATGAVVGTTNTQTLTNKTLTAPVITTPTITSLTLGDGNIVFEGATADSYETTLTVAEPTADRTVTIPDATTTLVGTDTTQTLTNKTLTSPTITGTGAIAGTFTGNLTGNITGNVTGNVIGNVTGNVTGSSGSTTGNAATATALATGRTIALTGDVTGTSASFDGTGNASITAAIAANSIVNDDINSGAAIDWTKIAPSATVSTTELGYLDGVTSAIQTQIDSKLATTTASSTYAPLASPALTGVPTAPTAAANTNTTQVATTAYVQTELTDLIGGAPGALDTLNELAAALANDASYSTTITTALATKLPLAGGTMTGAIAMGTNKITGLGDPTNAQDAATKNYIDTTVLAPSNLTGPITSTGAATSIASQTGTGTKFVMDTSPTLVTPVLGVATATSINGTTIPSSKTLVATDSTAYVVPSQGGNSGKYLTTDGTTSSWGTIQAGSQVKIEGGAAVTYDYVDFVGMGTNTATAGTIKVQPLTPTGASTGKRIYTGTTTPSSPTSGDVWVDATASAGADLTIMSIMGAY